MTKQKDMEADDFERVTAYACKHLKLMSKDKLSRFVFAIINCASYWYENNKVNR